MCAKGEAESEECRECRERVRETACMLGTRKQLDCVENSLPVQQWRCTHICNTLDEPRLAYTGFQFDLFLQQGLATVHINPGEAPLVTLGTTRGCGQYSKEAGVAFPFSPGD